ncbi:hypothetical protein ALON55S_04674 [Alishewanella longhuensis]
MYSYFSQYWFPALPWENPEHYLKHSPIQHVGKVSTPTMLLTGEADYRTPISEQSNIIKRYNYVVLIQPWCASLEHLMHCMQAK